VRDLFNSGAANPARLYGLVIRKQKEDFRLLALPQAPPQLDKERREAHVWTVFLRHGETAPIKVLAFRRGGFDGEVRLSVTGLPSGVSCSGAVIEPGRSSTTLLLSASENAAAWGGEVQITGTSSIGGSEITRIASAGSLLWDVNDYATEPIHSRLTCGFYLSVAGDEFAPLAFTGEGRTNLEAQPNEKIHIPLQWIAKADLSGNLKFKPVGLPEFDGVAVLEVNSKTNVVSLELDLAQTKLPLGTHDFYVFAQGQAKYRRLTAEEVKAAEATVSAAKATPKDDKLAEASKAAAQRLQFEERSFTAYSPRLTLRVTPGPTATTASKQ
jgi:hypothetical protein